LPVDDVHIGQVVHVEADGLVAQARRICGERRHYGEQLAPSDLLRRLMVWCVFRGVDPAEGCPYLKVMGPRAGVDRARRWCGLQVEAEATEAGI
jgi:hypothetical protein